MSENWPYEQEAKAFDEADFDLSTMRRSDTRVTREPVTLRPGCDGAGGNEPWPEVS